MVQVQIDADLQKTILPYPYVDNEKGLLLATMLVQDCVKLCGMYCFEARQSFKKLQGLRSKPDVMKGRNKK